MLVRATPAAARPAVPVVRAGAQAPGRPAAAGRAWLVAPPSRRGRVPSHGAGQLQRATNPSAASQQPPATPVTARWVLSVRFGSRADVAALLAEWIEAVAQPAGLQPGRARVLAGAVGAPDGRLELELRLPSLAALEALWAALPAGVHRAWGERLARHIEGSPRWEVLHELGGGSGGGGGEATAAGAGAAPARTPPPPPTPGAVGAAPLSPGGIALLSSPGDVDAVLAWSGGDSGNGGGTGGGGRPRSGDVLIPAPWAEAAGPGTSGGSGTPPPPAPSTPPPASVGQRAADDTPYGRSGGGDDAHGDEANNLRPGQILPDGSRVSTDWKGDILIIRPGDNLPGL